MTTEIAIMNKSAVALAADSAVTIRTTGPQGQHHKVLNTANKLFALSKYAPVGLMIYGNAGMLGIPWETIVKVFREHLGNKDFPTLTGYCDSFFDFLDNFDVDDELQQSHIGDVAHAWCADLRLKIDTWVEQQNPTPSTPLPASKIKAKLHEIFKIAYSRALDFGKESVHTKTKRQSLRKKYRTLVKEIANKTFENMPISATMHSNLLTITINAATVAYGNQSGIVIAGFGVKDLYPHCYDYDVTAVIAGKTIRKSKQQQQIHHDNTAVIMPFAQSDDVHTFMRGIGPELNNFLQTTFKEIMQDKLPNVIKDEISNKLKLTAQHKKDVSKIAEEMCKGACDAAFEQLAVQQRDRYIAPVLDATGFLNKAELAAMAETLVNLVSFRKQVTMEAETVGGPIDVAIISKGDGFTWIKRKHYFPQELNHHFFTNYHRKVYCNGEEN